jgi:hypothetical protein
MNFSIVDNRIEAIRNILNPDKLAHIGQSGSHPIPPLE